MGTALANGAAISCVDRRCVGDNIGRGAIRWAVPTGDEWWREGDDVILRYRRCGRVSGIRSKGEGLKEGLVVCLQAYVKVRERGGGGGFMQ